VLQTFVTFGLVRLRSVVVVATLRRKQRQSNDDDDDDNDEDDDDDDDDDDDGDDGDDDDESVCLPAVKVLHFVFSRNIPITRTPQSTNLMQTRCL